MVEDRLTRPAAPPVRTLLHRGLPAPLPRRPTWPASFLIWFPLVVFLMFLLPVTFGVMHSVLYDDMAQDFPSVGSVTVALLAGFTAIGYELVALVRRRRHRRRP